MNSINSVKANAEDDDKYDRKESSSGKPYFNLNAGNGQVMALASEAIKANGIASAKSSAPSAETEDATA